MCEARGNEESALHFAQQFYEIASISTSRRAQAVSRIQILLTELLDAHDMASRPPNHQIMLTALEKIANHDLTDGWCGSIARKALEAIADRR